MQTVTDDKERKSARRLIRHAMVAASAAAIGGVVMAPQAKAVGANNTTVTINASNTIAGAVSLDGGNTLLEDEGVSATNGGSITMTGSIVAIDQILDPNGVGDAKFYPKGNGTPLNWGNVKYAVVGAKGAGSEIIGNGVTIDITNATNGIVTALNGGHIDISNSSITGNLATDESMAYYYEFTSATGVGIQTVLSQGANSNVKLVNDTITTNGYDHHYHSAGITAQGDGVTGSGSITLGGTINVYSHGDKTYGVTAEGWTQGGIINTDTNNPLTLNITTDGDNSPGVYAGNGPVGTVTDLSSIDLNAVAGSNSSITTTGDNSDGVKIDNGASVTLHNITVNPQGTGSAAVRFTGDGSGIFSGDGVTLNGDIISEDDGTNAVNLQNHSELNGNVTNLNTLTIDPTSTWNVTGNSIVHDFTNNGNYTFATPSANADLSDPNSYRTLTVDNFHAGTDSAFTINIFTDGEDSQSNKLIINDSYDGPTTTINKNFLNGYNALPKDGLPVVIAGTNPNAFAQEDFFDPSQHGIYTYYGAYSGPPATFSLFSKINSAVAAASVLPALGARTILSTLPTVQDRMHAPRSSVTGTGQGDAAKGVWARLFGGSNKFRSDDSEEVGFDTSLWAVQAGYDFIANKSANGGRNYAGLYLAYGNSSGDAQVGGDDVGNVELNATSVGAYWTKYTPSNAYLSVTGQYSWLGGIKAGGDGESVSPDGSGFAISVEGGKTLNEDKSMLIEPQAQLIYQHTDIDNVTLPAGGIRPDDTPLSLSNMNSVTGRLGVLFQKNPKGGENFLPWARVNLWHTFSGSSDLTTPQSDSLESSLKGTSLELRAGFNFLGNEDSKFSVSGDGGYLFGLSGAKNSGWRGSVGVNYKW